MAVCRGNRYLAILRSLWRALHDLRSASKNAVGQSHRCVMTRSAPRGGVASLMSRFLKALVPCLLSIGLTGCHPLKDHWEWNQKLTVEVITPEGLRAGSAVTYVRWREANALGNYQTEFDGEATVVDLGAARYLFALIGEDTKQIAAYTLHAELGEQRADYEALFPKIMSFRGVREVPRDRVPLLVTFDDITDPTTVRRVDPAKLGAVFGPGVSLGKVSLEITNDEITSGKVGALLTWLGSYYDKRLDGQRFESNTAENRFANSLSPGRFATRE